MAEYPCNFTYQSSDHTLHWEGTQGVDEYLIEYSTDTMHVKWDVAYSGGNETSCQFNPTPGIVAVKGKQKSKDTWGGYGPVEYITVSP